MTGSDGRSGECGDGILVLWIKIEKGVDDQIMVALYGVWRQWIVTKRIASDEEDSRLVEGWPNANGESGGYLVKEAQRWHRLINGGYGGLQGVGQQCDGGW